MLTLSICCGPFLKKQYSTEHIHAAQVGVDVKTFRKWAWLYTGALAKLAPKLVSFKMKVLWL